MKGMIVAHGTSQDITCPKEATVKIAKAARSKGYQVKEIGGPGSTESAIFVTTPTPKSAAPIDEGGDLMLPHLVALLAGVVMGAGIDAIKENIQDAFKAMLEQRVTSIDFVGFSRGAVAIAHVLEDFNTIFLGTGIKINVCLLDPVPGPILVKQNAKIPWFVHRCMLLTSKHEGRPGFGPLGLEVCEGVKFTGRLMVGVHGDIGGSTDSDITKLVLDDIAKFLGWHDAFRLRPEDRQSLIVECAINGTGLDKSFLQCISGRGVGLSEHEHASGLLELPFTGAEEELLTPRHLPAQRFPALRPHDHRRAAASISRTNKLTSLLIQGGPVLGPQRELVITPSRLEARRIVLDNFKRIALNRAISRFMRGK